MQELPKGDALRPQALISYRALLEKTASRISTVQEILPAKLTIPLGSRILFLSLNSSYFTTCPHSFNHEHTYQA